VLVCGCCCALPISVPAAWVCQVSVLVRCELSYPVVLDRVVLPERYVEQRLLRDYGPLVHVSLGVGVGCVVSTLGVPLSK